MQVIFWNIGENLTIRKIALIALAIETIKPEIFSIAEGTISKNDCRILESIFLDRKYAIYYSPGQNYSDLTNIKYNKNGLKIFYNKESLLTKSIEPFSATKLREDGRIISVNLSLNYKESTLIFFHNKSKNNSRETQPSQIKYLTRLSDMIKYGFSKLKKSPIIIGDFNLEPWDNVLRDKDFIHSCFLNIHNEILYRNTHSKHYFNPIPSKIFKTKNRNLGGTFYNEKFGWALFDYVLYPTNEFNIDFNIITKISNKKLLESRINVNTKFILNNIDHLPIKINFK